MNTSKFKVFLFPMSGHGHTIPFLSMALLFAKHGAGVSVITTPKEASNLSKFVSDSQNADLDINFLTLTFPAQKAGLPEGVSHFDDADSFDMIQKLILGASFLSSPLESILEEHKPNCLVVDMFYPWSLAVAAKIGIPTVIFGGFSFFSSAAHECVRLYKPHLNVSDDDEPFVIPNFPGNIEMTRGTLPIPMMTENAFSKLIEDSKDAETKCNGVLMNSFYELEPVYADHFRNELGRKAWHIGPLSLFNKSLDKKMKGEKGRESLRGDHECLKWLDSKEPNSVIYVCFGSMVRFSPWQLREIAEGLQNSGLNFIWVVRKCANMEWLPESFEKKVEGRGMIINGWAPQVMILEREAVGGFVTHCGWNSTLEGICAGVPMVTWPLAAEQFFNEKLVTEILKVGVGVGVKRWGSADVGSVALEKAMVRVMVGEEAQERRSRARELAELATMAVEEGGSSFSDLRAFIDEFTVK